MKSAKKYDSFDISTGMNIPSFRDSVSIELDSTLLTVRYDELSDLIFIVIFVRFGFILSLECLNYYLALILLVFGLM